ncbi:hypothetical protein C5167_050649 [Papaver somniferum]|uniref:Uncharacterized protein n=1 Tax=Papaver somniferum TaxID=3469 RepID=A0A4Y7KT78_PAPSO|nr:hypothetical protein C5167_050649 [Papaver somniferum]
MSSPSIRCLNIRQLEVREGVQMAGMSNTMRFKGIILHYYDGLMDAMCLMVFDIRYRTTRNHAYSKITKFNVAFEPQLARFHLCRFTQIDVAETFVVDLDRAIHNDLMLDR